MAEIIKQSDYALNSSSAQETKDANPGYTHRRRRIIKAKNTKLSANGMSAQMVGSPSDLPKINPIKAGDYIEGVEILCRCGEKMIIHFDVENNG